MQGLADGYFVLPYTIQNYLSDQIQVPRFSTDLPEFEKAEKEVQAKIDKLMAYDALNREESCGGHFREEYQTPEGEAMRRDDEFSYVACWKYEGEGKKPELLKEPLNYEYIKVQTRNYKS